ncbi:glycosyltransferase family 4 protein [Mesonia mobilis]|uniref:Group 1 glycosyl transferase n=1 Tax=Mesonia mobilis TaxID=369791 RepID=A0ABQ3BQA1_9FLAO|nr:glycosyltransferase family 4 protein [Mesonia mobilis]MBQ0739029.1 glycosyltransferase family 4 protein [Aquimarina celericrescens]GGZ53340.1 group 1 glycosyl transferase [Mesonia mobilis]
MKTKSYKIVIFDGTFQTTTFIRRLMQGLVSHRHEVYVLGFNLHNPSPVQGVNYVSLGSNQNKFEFIKTSLRYQGPKVISQLLNLEKRKIQEKNFCEVIESIQPDLIHVQWNSLLPWVEPFLTHQNFPVILSQRGFQTNIRPFVNKENYNYLKRIYPLLSGLHSVSKAISDTGNRIGIPLTKVDHVVYTGLNLAEFPPIEPYRSRKQLSIISVGRAHWIKDYGMAVRACAILKQRHINFQYSILGAAGDEELTYLIQDLKLTEYIQLLPQLPLEKVKAMVKTSSLSLMTSIEEGIANVAVEAMALGTPVISTNCGGMEELITHGKEGWIVPIRDPLALAEQIEAFTKLTEKEIESIRQAARLKVETNFNEAQMVIGMEGLYRQVLSSEE